MDVDNNHSFGGLAGLNGGENSPDPFALAADAQAVLRAVRGGKVYPDEDQRRILIRYLSSLLWVDISDIVKCPPVFYFRLASGREIEFPGVNDVLDFRRFCLRWANSVGDVPDGISVFRDLRSGYGVMMRMRTYRPLRKSRNEAT